MVVVYPSLLVLIQIVANEAPKASKQMRNHAQLDNESQHTFEYLELFIVHELAHFNCKVFKILQVCPVLHQFEVPQKNEWSHEEGIWHYGN